MEDVVLSLIVRESSVGSIVDDFYVQRSIVSSRVALLLRSAEINLLLFDFLVAEWFRFF